MCTISLRNPHGRYSSFFPLLPVDGSPLGKQICCWKQGSEFKVQMPPQAIACFPQPQKKLCPLVTLIAMQSWNIMSDLKADPGTYVLKKVSWGNDQHLQRPGQPALPKSSLFFCMCNCVCLCSVWGGVHACESMHVHMCVCICRALILMSGLFLHYSPLYILSQGPSREPLADNLAAVASQLAPGIVCFIC